MTPDEIAQRSIRAKQLLEDPLLKECFDIIEHDIVEMWVVCPERDLEGQRLLQNHIRNTRKLKDILLGVMESGKLAAFREQTVRERISNLVRKT